MSKSPNVNAGFDYSSSGKGLFASIVSSRWFPGQNPPSPGNPEGEYYPGVQPGWPVYAIARPWGVNDLNDPNSRQYGDRRTFRFMIWYSPYGPVKPMQSPLSEGWVLLWGNMAEGGAGWYVYVKQLDPASDQDVEYFEHDGDPYVFIYTAFYAFSVRGVELDFPFLPTEYPWTGSSQEGSVTPANVEMPWAATTSQLSVIVTVSLNRIGTAQSMATTYSGGLLPAEVGHTPSAYWNRGDWRPQFQKADPAAPGIGGPSPHGIYMSTVWKWHHMHHGGGRPPLIRAMSNIDPQHGVQTFRLTIRGQFVQPIMF